MDRVFIGVFVMIFICLILFIALNTIMSEHVFPIFDEIANSSGMNETLEPFDYGSKSSFFQTVFFTSIYIILIIPFLYILIRILKKEPEPQPYYGGQ